MSEDPHRPRFLHETHSQQLHREEALRRRQQLAARENTRPPAMHFGTSQRLRSGGRAAKSVSPAPRAEEPRRDPPTRSRPRSRERSHRLPRPPGAARKPSFPRARSYRSSPGASRVPSPRLAQRAATPPPQQQQQQQQQSAATADRTRKRLRSVPVRPPFLSGSPVRKTTRTPTPPPQQREVQSAAAEALAPPLRAVETASPEEIASGAPFALPRATLQGSKRFDWVETVEEEQVRFSIGEFRMPCTPKCRASRQSLSASPRAQRSISFAPTASPQNENGEEPLRLHSAEAAEEPVAVEIVRSPFTTVGATPLVPLGDSTILSTERKISLTASGNSWHAYDCSTTTVEDSAVGQSPTSEDFSREERRQLFAHGAGITPTDDDDDDEIKNNTEGLESGLRSVISEEVNEEKGVEEDNFNEKNEEDEEKVQSDSIENEDDVVGKEEGTAEKVQSDAIENEDDVVGKEEGTAEKVQSDAIENENDVTGNEKPMTVPPTTGFALPGDAADIATASYLFTDCVSAPSTPDLQLPDAYRQLEATRREMASQQRHTRRAEERRSESRRGSIFLATGDLAVPQEPVLQEPHTPPPSQFPQPTQSPPTRLAVLTRSPIPRPVPLRSHVASPAPPTPREGPSTPCAQESLASVVPESAKLSITPQRPTLQRSRSRSVTGRKSELERLMESCPPDAREEAEQLIAADATAAALTPLRTMGSGQLSEILTDSSTISQRVAARPRKYYYDYTFWERHLNEITASGGRRRRRKAKKAKKAAVAKTENATPEESSLQKQSSVATKRTAQKSLRNSLSKKNRDRIIAQRRIAARRHKKKH